MLLIRVFALVVLLPSCLASKFVMFPMWGRSHYLVLARLARELEERGHEVVMFVGDCETYAVKDRNVRTFKCPEIIAKDDHTVPNITDLIEGWPTYCDAKLSKQDIMNEVKTADFVIGDAVYLCSVLIADHFSLPHGAILMSPLSSATGTLPFNFPVLPSYIPQALAGMTDNMNFLERVLNTLIFFLNRLTLPQILHSVYGPLKHKRGITPEKTLQQTFERTDIIIATTHLHFAIDYPRSLPPNTKLVGPILASPAKPLPAELEEFFKESGDDGVILVSFGTILGVLDDRTFTAMADAFSRVPQKVIWKLKTEGKSLTFSENIKVVSWLPQNDILGHHKTRLFIGHGGFNGMLEAAYHGVPMIIMPFFADQFDNGATAKHFGMAEVVDSKSITKESLVKTINTVVINNSYRESASRISKAIRQRRRTPIQEAADWMEYALAQGGLQYLRPRSLDLPFYQLYLLDVLFAAILVLVGVLFVTKLLLKCCIRLCFKSKFTKEKSH